jgi:CHAT domain-containing protein/tetratricopeptide (TPR) repeat protein
MNGADGRSISRGSAIWAAWLILLLAGASRAQSVSDQYFAALQTGRYAEAEQIARQQLQQVNAGGDERAIGMWSALLGFAYSDQGRAREAEPLLVRALPLIEKSFGAGHATVAEVLAGLGKVYIRQSRPSDAEPLFKRALAIQERLLDPDDPTLADTLESFALVYFPDRATEGERLIKRALSILEKKFGVEHHKLARPLANLAGFYHYQRQFVAEEALRNRVLSIDEKIVRADDPRIGDDLRELAQAIEAQGRSSEAEPLIKRSLAIMEKAFPSEHPKVASCLEVLAGHYTLQGRYPEAEEICRKALQTRLRANGDDVEGTLGQLAAICEALGKYSEAESLYRRVMSLNERRWGRENRNAGVYLTFLAGVYAKQRRYAEAEPLLKRALAIIEKEQPIRDADLAISYNRLAMIESALGRGPEADAAQKEAEQIFQRSVHPDHPWFPYVLYYSAEVDIAQGRYSAAESRYERALAGQSKELPADHPVLASTRVGLAELYWKGEDLVRAELLLDQAISILDQAAVSPGERFRGYFVRARIRWKRGRQSAAIADLRHALDLAEQQRGFSSGAELEQGKVFGGFAQSFETMVSWQAELRDLDEAFAVMERARARTLAEQMDRRGVDLLAGVPRNEAETLRQRESKARSLVSELEKQLTVLGERRDLSLEQRKQRADSLHRGLAEARQEYVDAYREIRNASPAYRLSLAKDRKPLALAALRKWAAAHRSLILEYMVGDEQSFVVVVPPAGSQGRIEALQLNAEQAARLGVEAGPMTSARLQAILTNPNQTGVLQRISTPGSDRAVVDQLAALWQVLVPEPERKSILAGTFESLVVLPDGPLALLPFETLVVERGNDPAYLLDAGPRITYGPSATVFHNLSEQSTSMAADREPVLAVGDPAYGGAGADNAKPAELLASLTSRSRYGDVGGKLNRLPHSGTEMNWVAEAFRDGGIKAVTLDQATATERGVRYWASGRRVLHLACHGLVDQEYGNFFGALALTPGPKRSENPADDGFLTLPEIYELNLKGCELAILSACQTNYGPLQKGEGTWALSRGFLVAGARRVVASNWLVDDEAAASLVSRFCGGLAQAEKAGKTVDYAASLQEAKRWVRKQEKWRSPYYWASLVLVGPP